MNVLFVTTLFMMHIDVLTDFGCLIFKMFFRVKNIKHGETTQRGIKLLLQN